MPEAVRLEIEPRFKVWRTTPDEIARDSHAAANGQVRFVGEPFLVGDASLTEPRDPDGPPEETFNCRCLKDEYTLSDLPAELFSQVEGRLTPSQRRLLRGGVRVADAGDEIPDGLSDEEIGAEIIEVLVELRNRRISLATNIPQNVFGEAYDEEKKLELLQQINNELQSMEGRGLSGLTENIEIVAHVPTDNDPNNLGKTIGRKIALRVEIDDLALQGAIQSSAFGNERAKTKERLIAYNFRHELGHALTQNKDNISNLFSNPLRFIKAIPGIEQRAQNQPTKELRKAEIFTEAFAWFTSPDYPHDNPDDPKRLPESFENVLRDFIEKRMQ